MLQPLRLCSGTAAGARLHPNVDNVCVCHKGRKADCISGLLFFIFYVLG